MLLKEHHKWKDFILLDGSSPVFPSNFSMSEGNLIGMGPCSIMFNRVICNLGQIRENPSSHKWNTLSTRCTRISGCSGTHMGIWSRISIGGSVSSRYGYYWTYR